LIELYQSNIQIFDIKKTKDMDEEFLIFKAISLSGQGKLDELKEFVSKNNFDINKGDYDKRNALHLGIL
jgi:hypothetical protein